METKNHISVDYRWPDVIRLHPGGFASAEGWEIRRIEAQPEDPTAAVLEEEPPAEPPICWTAVDYAVANPGTVSLREVADALQRLVVTKQFDAATTLLSEVSTLGDAKSC